MTPQRPAPSRRYLYFFAFCMALIALAYIGLYFFGSAQVRPSGLLTVIMVLPALVVIPGLLRGHYKTMVWAALIALFYLLLAATDAWASPHDQLLHLFVAIISSAGFISAWWYSIQRRRHLKSQIPSTGSDPGAVDP